MNATQMAINSIPLSHTMLFHLSFKVIKKFVLRTMKIGGLFDEKIKPNSYFCYLFIMFNRSLEYRGIIPTNVDVFIIGTQIPGKMQNIIATRIMHYAF